MTTTTASSSPTVIDVTPGPSTQPPSRTIQIDLALFDRYVDVAMRRGEPRKLDGETRWYADLAGFPGVWSQGDSPKECLDELEGVLRDWITMKIVDGDRDIPVVDEIDLTALIYRY